MKKIIIITLAIIASITAIAQDRVNEEQYCFTENSKKVSKITHWGFYNGKWYDTPTLDVKKLSKAKRIEISHTHNVSYIQLHKFVYENNPFYVVDICHETGYYIYEAICEDWRPQTEHKYFLLTEEQKQLFESPTEDLTCLELRYASYWEGGVNTQKEIENREIRELVRSDLRYPLTDKIAFKRYKDVVRFDFEDSHNNKFNFDEKYFEVQLTDWVF